MASAAYDRFIASMKIGFDEWHDGVGYDLEALADVTPDERVRIESMLLARNTEDWRVVEALTALNTPASIAAVRSSLQATDPVVRLAAARELHQQGQLADLTEVVTGALRSGNSAAFSQAIDIIGWHTVRGAEPELFHICARGTGENACHCAAMLYFLHGLSEEAFDWNHRPFFLRFNTDDRDEREAAFRELCEKVGADPTAYLTR